MSIQKLLTELLLTVLALTACQVATAQLPAPPNLSTEPPLPGENAITRLEVRQDSEDRWIVDCDYFFTGAGAPYVLINVNWSIGSDSYPLGYQPSGEGYVMSARRGNNHINYVLTRPQFGGSITTRLVVAKLVQSNSVAFANSGAVLANKEIAQAIYWPDYETQLIDTEVRTKSTEEVLERIAGLVDSATSTSLDNARRLLERLLRKDPNIAEAFLELARIAMRREWNAQGLRKAEVLIASALQIKPGGANGLILQGYVFTHQGRFREAEKTFVDASAGNPVNLWLWSNWGELLVKRGDLEGAISKYSRAIDHAPTRNTYDRAREDAFVKLMAIFEKRGNIEGLETLHQLRIKDYGPERCYAADYAGFKIRARGDAVAAISLAALAPEVNCPADKGKETLGLAYYLAWATRNGTDKASFLNQARLYYPPGVALLYELASSDRTMDIARQMVKSGEEIDQIDDRQMNALAYAMNDKDYEVASRLLALGAKPERVLGPNGLPVALIPVLAKDYRGVQLLVKRGVNYAKITYQGTTAVEFAKRSGDKKLTDALNVKGPGA